MFYSNHTLFIALYSNAILFCAQRLCIFLVVRPCRARNPCFINPSALHCFLSSPSAGGDCRIFLSHGQTEQRRLQDCEAPADCLCAPQQLSVWGAAPLAHLPWAGLHHQGVHETGWPARHVIQFYFFSYKLLHISDSQLVNNDRLIKCNWLVAPGCSRVVRFHTANAF